MESVNQMSEYVNKGLNFVNQNKILSSVLGMLLVLYAAAAAPKLPKSVVKIFDNSLFKLGFMFMIAYLATKDPSVAIISAVALLITIQTLASREAAEVAVQAAAAPQATTESELRKVAQERIMARQEVAPEIKVVSEQNKQVALKESFGEDGEVRIPLSPARAEFIEESTRKADAHYSAAEQAKAEGNLVLAEAHQQEAVKQEIKVEAAITAKQHMIAAEEAKSAGNMALAEAHMDEAAKQEAKAEALVKSEAHAIAAEEAKSAGNMALAEAHANEAAKQEAKAEAIVMSEAHASAAQEALARGAIAEAEAHKREAVKQEAKAIAMVKAETEAQPTRAEVESEATGIPVPFSEAEHALVPPSRPMAEIAVGEVPVSEAKKAMCGSPFDVEGYSGAEYANL